MTRARRAVGGACFRIASIVLMAVAWAAGWVACAPALNWREVRPSGSGLEAVFPCRPDRHERRVLLAGASVSMQMEVCAAAGLTFAVSFVDLDTPERLARGVTELRALAVGNIGGTESQSDALQVPGMTPNPGAVVLGVQGRLAGTAPVRLRAAFFSKGLRLFQATVLGADPSDDATQPFFAGLRLPT